LKLVAQSKSVDSRLLKKIKKQKEQLQSHGVLEQSHGALQQEEMQMVAIAAKKMKDFWVRLTNQAKTIRPNNSHVNRLWNENSTDANISSNSGSNVHQMIHDINEAGPKTGSSSASQMHLV